MNALYYLPDSTIQTLAEEYVSTIVENFEKTNGHRKIKAEVAGRQGLKLFIIECRLGWFKEYRDKKFSKELKSYMEKKFIEFGKSNLDLM